MMKLLRLQDMPADPQSRSFGSSLAPAFGLPAVFLAALGVQIWMIAHDPGTFGRIFLGFMSIVTFLGVLLLLNNLRAALRPTNWLVQVAPTILWVHFRSYLNWRYSDDTPSVVALDLNEIASANLFTETLRSPSSSGGGTKIQWFSYLEIRLRHDQTADLAAAIQFEMNRPGYGTGRESSKALDYPVRLREPALLRVRFDTRRRVRRVLAVLQDRVRIGEAEHLDTGRWDELQGREIEDQIVRLCEAGDRIGAIELARRRYSYSLTEAKAFVDDLVGER